MKRLVQIGMVTSLGLLVGCVESNLNPTDTVRVTGKALREDLSPIADVTLKLHRSRNSICLLPDHYRDLQTDAAGAFTLDLTGAETQNGELARCFQLRLPLAEGKATASATFMMQVTEVDVPQLQLWNGTLTAATTAEGAEVSFKKISETHDFSADAQLALGLGGLPAWNTPAAATPAVLSARVLEDFDGLTARLNAFREIRGSGTRFDLAYASDEVSVPRGSLVPVSRGAGCQFGAKLYEDAANPCPVTDGKLTKPLSGDASDLRINLTLPTKLSRVVVRGFGYSIGAKVVIEGSVDGGVNWTSLIDLGEQPVGAFAELELKDSAPAVQHVRLRVEGAGTGEAKINSLSQFSLFE